MIFYIETLNLKIFYLIIVINLNFAILDGKNILNSGLQTKLNPKGILFVELMSI